MAVEPKEERLWPGEAPGSEGVENTERREGPRIFDVTVPTLTYYPVPADKARGITVLVCPGGAYQRLAMAHEGWGVAEWLNSLGITAVVLKYRCGKQIAGSDTIDKLPVADGMRAIRTVRGKAGELGIRTDRIGIMGFSAGGNLAVRLVCRMDKGDPDAADPIDRVSCRPDFVVLGYAPVPDLKPGTISKDTPPFFMFHAADDRIPNVGCAKLFTDLYAAAVPAELHIFASGGHGFGMGNRGGAVTAWCKLFETWITDLWKFKDSFAPDYLKPIGGEGQAVIKGDTEVSYSDLAGGDQVVKAQPLAAAEDGMVSSEYSDANIGRRVAYAFCCLRCDKAQKVQCYFGSDEEACVWINGKLVLRKEWPHQFMERDDSFTADLAAGLNPVMVKVSQRTALYAFKFEAVGELPAGAASGPVSATSRPGSTDSQPVNELRTDGRVRNWLVLNFHLTKPAATQPSRTGTRP